MPRPFTVLYADPVPVPVPFIKPTTTMSTSDIKGYAIRRNNSCLSDEVGCGRTWETWHACCPSGSKCPGKEYSIQNNVCCPTWTDCTSEIKPATCANSSWNMYDYDGYFCCTEDESGFRLKGTDWVGCLSPDSPGNASYSALRLIATSEYITSKTDRYLQIHS